MAGLGRASASGAIARGARRTGRGAQAAALMRFIAPIALLAAALAALLLTPPQARCSGSIIGSFASAAIGAAILLWLLLSGLRSARPSDIARIAAAAMIWAAAPGRADRRLRLSLRSCRGRRPRRRRTSFRPNRRSGEGGEVIVNRRLSGEFAIAARVNGARVTFLFDTGASAVVLTAADARRAGIGGRARRSMCRSPPPTARRWPPRRGSTRSPSGRSSCATSGPGRAPRRARRKPARHELSRAAEELHGRTRSAGHGREVGARLYSAAAGSRARSTRETASRNTSSPAPRLTASVARTCRKKRAPGRPPNRPWRWRV